MNIKNLFILEVLKTFSLNSWLYIWNFSRYNFVEHLLEDLVKCNILFVKIYQALASNTIAIDKRYIKYLKKYTDHVPYTTLTNDKKIINDLGFNFDQTTLINSGTIAIVYKTIYKNKDVIIKIKREELFLKQEFEKMVFLCKLLSYIPILWNFNLTNVIETNRELILNQLDFKKEVSNIKTMQNIHRRIDYIKIPIVYEEFTDKNNDVIVMEYLYGNTIYKVHPSDYKNYALLFSQFGIKSLLFDGIYHADLHPGNIIFMKNNKTNKNILGIIDFGIVNHITKEEQNNYFLFYKYLNNKFELAKHIIYNMSYKENKQEQLSENKKEKLIYEIQEVVYIFNKKLTFDDILKISNILKKYDYKLCNYFYKLLLGLVSCEGTMNYLTNNKNNLELLNETFQKMYNHLLI